MPDPSIAAVWAPMDGTFPLPNPEYVLGLDLLSRGENNFDHASKKRYGSDDKIFANRAGSPAKPGTKACREKMRRDKLNDRFLELLSILEPGRPPKVDKAAILSDAARRLAQLRLEAEKLRESNEALLSIKALRREREMGLFFQDEKVKLKAEKDRIEQMLNDAGMPPGAAAFPAAAFVACNKNVPFANYPPPHLAMWQWLPRRPWTPPKITS
ncbi:unnamed protein product [Spirodela intermedia]|uniref:BHLH domain-containing protein n=1 Tax=Spirodela intermedia TaxID=51605 RepID=A0A7I8JJ16_SPIIN|nr:unnamed protein product [Spirodela intermedia]CAA6669412.1 unnamed protein product [Spirodela intermedia]